MENNNQPKNNSQNSAITPQEINFAKWYDDVLKNADLIHYSEVKGTVIFNPNATVIWEKIKAKIDQYFKPLGIKNLMMPTLIPYEDFLLEKQHLSGFAPEMFIVTKNTVGQEGSALDSQKLVLRPTSEILFCRYFKDTLVSYSQLPFKFNQWANVFRVEKNTRPFLRTSEFYWQEMHSIHASEQEAIDFAKKLNEVYTQFIENDLNIPVLNGTKTEYERFAGAEQTYTCEALMPDGQALQCATSHFLGQNFVKPYKVMYRDENNEVVYPYQTSAGISTRIIGAIIMTHSDNKGLVLPWSVAFIRFAICLLNSTDEMLAYANKLKELLHDEDTVIDQENKGLGFKIKKYEALGCPFILLIGKKEMETNSITVINRLDDVKITYTVSDFIAKLPSLIGQYNQLLRTKANKILDNGIEVCHTLDEVKQAIANKHIALAPWAGSVEEEKQFKKETTFSTRCIKEEVKDPNLKCIYTNKPAVYWVYFAKAY